MPGYIRDTVSQVVLPAKFLLCVQYPVFLPEGDESPYEIRDTSVSLGKSPGYPADIIVARIRVIIASLCVAEFIACIYERNSLR